MKRRTDPLSRALKERDQALRERDEARAFQAATDEILTAISRSPSDAKPVFEAIVQNVPRLFQTRYVSVFLVKGEELHLAAAKADSRFEKQHAAVFRKFRESFPQPIDYRGFTGSALRSGKVSQMAPIIGNPRATPQAVKLARQFGYNTMLVAPLMRDGRAIGAIGTTRPEVKPFTTRELALFRAFAAQAVIAIENARLFNETREALEQQTATSEILRVISSSPGDIHPVLDTILENGLRLCEARHGSVFTFDGEAFHVARSSGQLRPQFLERLKTAAIRPGRETPLRRVGLELRPVHCADLVNDSSYSLPREYVQEGFRSALAVPVLKDGKLIGALAFHRREVRPFSERQIALLQTFADQAVIAIENARLFNETKEALERQKATSEILGAISSSPTDLQPIFDVILENTLRLCDANLGIVGLCDGNKYQTGAQRGASAEFARYLAERGPLEPPPDTALGRMIAERRPVHVADLKATATYRNGIQTSVMAVDVGGIRTFLGVPMLREGRVVGGISIYRREVRPFTQKQIDLVSTFADQAVIAIENVRLFNETKEALERQTATAEILKVISASPTSTQPVFESIVKNCGTLYKDSRVALWLISDGRLFSRASTGYISDPIPLDRDSGIGACVLESRTIHVPDLRMGAEQYPRIKQLGLKHGYLSGVFAPLLREGRAVGAISVLRRELGAFSEKEVALLTTFADQAVIAIENARLFNETKEALERQTATAEILKVISGSPTNIQPVFDAILDNATRLCDAHLGFLSLYDGDKFQTVAHYGTNPEFANWIIARGRFDPSPGSGLDHLKAKPQPVQFEDYRETAAYRSRWPMSIKLVELGGVRSYLAVPLLKEGRLIGGITVYRPEVRSFTQRQIDLLCTFADQAVIAIENVRLFNETKEALERQTASADVLRVIGSSPSDLQPVFDAILESAMRLCDASLATVGLYDGKLYRHVAQRGGSPEYVKFLFAEPFEPSPQYTLGRVIAERQPFHTADYRELPAYKEGNPRSVATVELGGARTFLAVPMLKDGQVIGGITLRRTEVRPFTQKQIDLVKTFADQAVIAIENARLFSETKEALEQQTATAEILKVIASSPTEVQPVFDVIVERAVRLCGARFGRVYRYDGSMVQMVASHGLSANGLGQVRRIFPRPAADDTIVGRVILARRPYFLQDIERDDSVPELSRQMIEALNTRSQVTIPMLRAGEPIGAITMGWEQPSGFDDQKVALLQTFADQAVIAIENVRLFNETKEALEHQTATTDVLKVISSSVADPRPVFTKILQSCQSLFAHGRVALGLLGEDDMMHLHLIPEDPERDAEGWRNRFRRAVEAAHPRAARDSIYGHAMRTGKVLYYPDVANDADVPEGLRKSVELVGTNYSVVFAPLLWEGRGIGALNVVRIPPTPFSEKEIRLLKTFADQAVIAIQNARLFNETREALERQTATAEILKVISSSPTDVQPVFEAIAQSAHRLFNRSAALQIVRDSVLHVGAVAGFSAEGLETVAALYPMELKASGRSLRAMREGKVLETTDVQAPGTPSSIVTIARAAGFRSIVTVPLLRGDELLGQLSLTADEVRPRLDEKQLGLLKTFADQAVIAIENVRLFNETKEALERQTASAEILGVISSTPTDVQPVFDAIVSSTQRLIAGKSAVLLLRRDPNFVVAAYAGPDVAHLPDEIRVAPLDRDKNFPSRAILDGEIVHVPDWQADDVIEHERNVGRAFGIKSGLMVPLLREGKGIGAIAVTRGTPGPYHEKEVALLRSFADQAVIAIENVRLFNETREALERQTATAEILKVISSSPADVQPVFDIIGKLAEKLCAAEISVVSRFDGELIQLAALHGVAREAVETVRRVFPMRLDEESVTARAYRKSAVVHVADVLADPEYAQKHTARAGGWRGALGVPMVREGQVIGVIFVARSTPGYFADAQVELLRTFADQAVIAVENVRLFNETREALERQTATAEILKVISSSPTDVQPVFDAVVQSCRRLFGGMDVALNMVQGEQFDRVAFSESSGVPDDTAGSFPMPLSEESIAGRAMLRAELVHIEDIAAATWLAERSRSIARRRGFRSALCAPMIREGRAIGSIIVFRAQPGRFKDEQVALLRTFADQAVIAIENVRLFKELQERTEALTRSVGQLTALGEVGQAISSSLELDEVLRTIVQRAVQLAGLDGGSIYEFDEADRRFHLRAAENIAEEILAVYRASPIRLGEGAVGRAGATREPVAVENVLDESYQSRVRELLIRSGSRALLAVPLLREDHLLGALVVNRKSPGPFAPEAVDLLKTFAMQSAVAIQNARLFREIAEKSKQLEVASRHKSQFLASMSHELRTPLNAILGFNEMILGQVYGEVPSDMQEPLEDIQKSGKHLLGLINNVLDLAKIEAGRMELALAEYSVQDTVESVRSTLRPLAEAKGLELVASVAQDIPLAYGDGGRLTQCLMNLAGNSLKFTKQGRVEIAVEAQNGLLKWRVSDTGIGIPPEKIETLFSEFKQTDATIASEYGGTGLGLSITKKFVEMHGGRIWVESEPGKGSTFTLEIPLRVKAPA